MTLVKQKKRGIELKEYQFLIDAVLAGIIISTTLFLIEKRKDVHNEKAFRFCEGATESSWPDFRLNEFFDCL